MNELVSIITPCYNAEKFINGYVEKIKQQTYRPIQLIFVNDGSNDSTEQKIMDRKTALEADGFHVTYIYQNNAGVGAAVNTGLKYIQGAFFAWCDVDCYYDSCFVSKMAGVLQQDSKLNIVRCDGAYVDQHSGRITKKYSEGYRTEQAGYRFEDSVLERDFHVGCAMLRTSEFERINPDREIYESREGQNWPLLMPMLYYNWCAYIDEVLFFNVFDPDSVSNRASKLGLKALLNQEEEYENILHHVFDSIADMSSDEQEKYLHLVKLKYLHRRLSLAQHYKDKKIGQAAYDELKQKHALNGKDRFYYYRLQLPIFEKLVSFAGRLIRR